MIKLTNVSLRRGPRELIENATASIHDGHKVGLTGANGCGKSSLMALIMGELIADNGHCYVPKNTVISHVAQETPAAAKEAIEAVLDGDPELRQIEQAIELAKNSSDGTLVAELYSRYETINGYTARHRAKRLMQGLGFQPDQYQKKVSEFSGGWRMRLNLASALMCRSDLMLLDEPTNHLDLETVIWLEDWLRGYKGSLLLISHDRDFLDRVCTHIMHIERQQLNIYSGNYSDFESRRAAMLAHQQAAYEKQQHEITHMKKYVERFRAKASKARQAQSRVKALERMTLATAAHVDSAFHFSFRDVDYLPNPMLRIKKADVGYGDELILENVNLSIIEGQRIGLLGRNGSGKSTLIKLLADEVAIGDLQLMRGTRKPAKGLKVGYFAQHQLEQLNDEDSPLQHLKRLDPDASEQSLRDYLGGYAFRGDMTTNPVKPFSGGEKARLVLAMIVYQQPNFLLLDEPTNHLDLDMRFALGVALQNFSGALVVVSHDRHLLRSVTDELYLVADKKVTVYDGDLDDYKIWLREQNMEAQQKKSSVNTAKNGMPIISKKEQRQQAADKRDALKPLTNKIKNLELKMETLQAEKEKLKNRLADPDIYTEQNKLELTQLLKKQAETEKPLLVLEEQWLLLNEELENVQR